MGKLLFNTSSAVLSKVGAGSACRACMGDRREEARCAAGPGQKKRPGLQICAAMRLPWLQAGCTTSSKQLFCRHCCPLCRALAPQWRAYALWTTSFQTWGAPEKTRGALGPLRHLLLSILNFGLYRRRPDPLPLHAPYQHGSGNGGRTTHYNLFSPSQCARNSTRIQGCVMQS